MNNQSDEQELPWQTEALMGWDIVGMNHYHQDGERRLFVAMSNGFRCIRAEGASETEVFHVLALNAAVVRADSTRSQTSKEYTREETTHLVNCRWKQLTTAQCTYRETHHYCPHPEHACTCPPEAKQAIEEAGKVGQLMNAADRDGYQRGLEDAAKAMCQFCVNPEYTEPKRRRKFRSPLQKRAQKTSQNVLLRRSENFSPPPLLKMKYPLR